MHDPINKDGTDTPQPWEFEIGSAESRAAARAMLQGKDRVDLRLIVDIGEPGTDGGRSYRCPMESGGLLEVVIL